jgi:uroporphyrinogen-III synthase
MHKIYLLSSQKFKDVENLEVFNIQYIKPNINIEDYDSLVFTSKNAIYSLNHYKMNWQNIPSYVIAPKTAEVVKQLGGNLAFTGTNGHGNEFANELIPYLQNKKVLYVKAEKTVSNLVEILKNNSINLDKAIAYKTVCNSSKTNLEKNSIFIFTSPSSIECFFNQYSWDKSFKAITIGKTTAEYLPKNIDYLISPQTSMQECIKLAKSL